jgi:uncharacterized protein YndB with AHSA1/START domain
VTALPKEIPMSTDDHFTISRRFDAPCELLWQAWTRSDQIAAWLAPKGTTSRVIRFDLRPGGEYLAAMEMPDGSESCGKFVYRDVTPISRLVWAHSFADVNGNLLRHPLSPTWPLELLTTVTFADLGAQTEVTLDWTPLNADEVERQTFIDGKASMQGGWSACFDQLSEHLTHHSSSFGTSRRLTIIPISALGGDMVGDEAGILPDAPDEA